jgi:isoleucyl-tRNA synthetase
MIDFKSIEERTRKLWKKKAKEIEKSLQNDPKKPLFSFLEGPPTANAPPGIHHLEGRTFKDIICKFRYMQGFSVPRKGGWDCHGLPVEVQIEKKLNLEDKKAIVHYGIDKFVDQCRKSVFSNIGEWNVSTEELGYWIDLKNPYVTLENDYIESVWWSLSELYKKGLLYEGHKVVPYCPRCGTPLSSHEVAQGYKEIKEDSVYIAFKLRERPGEYILAWTTTPWTLPGNVALAVGPKIKYVKVKLPDGDTLILGKDRLSILNMDYQVIEEIEGKKLVGLEYEPLYRIKELENKNSYKVISADFVTTDDGTGIVHTAGMYGEDDYSVCKENEIPLIHTVGEDGKFLDIAPEFLRGKFVKDCEKEIIEDLKKRHLLLKKEKISHTYPFCWRCDSILLYYAVNSWYVKVSAIKEKLVELNQEINWVPKYIKEGRFGKWLEGAKDWAISRFKFWGTPLPIWRCECGKEKIIGSVDELRKNSKDSFSEYDLHKPWIDQLKIKCSCGKIMTRIPDVIDCWYDSGSASFAQFHYPFENKEEFEKRFPYDFIAEGVDQTRGWFYTLHVLATALFDKPAYKNVISMGHVVDEKGDKMSKSKGNIIIPKEMINSAGVDATRLQFCTTDVGNSKRFSYDLIKESVMPFLNVLYNCKNYYLQLEENKNKQQIEDKWILSKLNSLLEKVTKFLGEYNLNEAFNEIQNFVVKDFSRNYIKMTRNREDVKEIIGEVLEKVSLLLAPFAPYISQEIYSLFSKELVALSSWPKFERKKIDLVIEKEMENVLDIIEKGLYERDKVHIGLKWPLSSMKVESPETIPEKYFEILKSQLNIKEISLELTDKKEISLQLNTEISPELEAEGYAREASRIIQAFRRDLGLFKKDEVELQFVVDETLSKILEKNKDFIRERVNARTISFVTTGEERFKNILDFKIKDKRGRLGLIKVA